MKIGFTGEVVAAECKCHKGQFLAVIYMIHPEQGRIYLHNVPFKTESEAAKELDNVVMLAAETVLQEMGLKKDEAKRIGVFHGAEAEKAEQRQLNEVNKNLH